MSDLVTVEYSKYIKKTVKPSTSAEWTLNGDNNSFFEYIRECYNSSPTNGTIINAFHKYIYGGGMIDKNGVNIYKYISKKDLKLMTLDFKLYGGFGVQVIWNSAKNLEDKKPIRYRYLPIRKVGLNINNEMEVNGYWYCYDWNDRGKYPPQFFQKFDGNYKIKEDSEDEGYDTEIALIQRTSSDEFFSNPDYLPGLQYAETEMELSNTSINHIKNNFQPSKIVNIPFEPETEELKEEYRRNILKNIQGTTNSNNVIVAFNQTAENKISVESVEITDLNAQQVWFAEEAERKLIVAHSAPPILFSGSREGGGLGNNSEEMKTATDMLYRKIINPYREDILDGLTDLLKHSEPNIDLEFLDFKEDSKNTVNRV